MRARDNRSALRGKRRVERGEPLLRNLRARIGGPEFLAREFCGVLENGAHTHAVLACIGNACVHQQQIELEFRAISLELRQHEPGARDRPLAGRNVTGRELKSRPNPQRVADLAGARWIKGLERLQ